jgi:hypothetical protein
VLLPLLDDQVVDVAKTRDQACFMVGEVSATLRMLGLEGRWAATAEEHDGTWFILTQHRPGK